jgi:putative transposase
MSTHIAISYHILFSTKDREPALHQDRRAEIFRYICGESSISARVTSIASTESWITRTSSPASIPRLCLADFVKNIKTGSARWIKQNAVFKRFSHWQEGYAAFTCARHDHDRLIEYERYLF